MSNAYSRYAATIKLQGTAKALLNVLADAANDNGYAYISIVSHQGRLDLVTWVGRGRNAIRAAADELMKRGYLVIKARPGRSYEWHIFPGLAGEVKAQFAHAKIRRAAPKRGFRDRRS